MKMLVEKDVVRVLIGLITLCVVSFLGIVYLLSALNHSMVYPDISVSDAFVVDPSRAVAAFLIPIATYFFVLVVVARLVRLYPYVFRAIDMWLFAFIILLLIVAFIGLMGVAAVPIDTQRTVHLVAAVMLFVGVGFLFIAFTLLDESIDLECSPTVRWYRIGLALLIFATGVALAVTQDLTEAAAAIIEIVIILQGLAYTWSWTSASEFPIKSRSLPARVSVMESERSNPPIYYVYY